MSRNNARSNGIAIELSFRIKSSEWLINNSFTSHFVSSTTHPPFKISIILNPNDDIKPTIGRIIRPQLENNPVLNDHVPCPEIMINRIERACSMAVDKMLQGCNQLDLKFKISVAHLLFDEGMAEAIERSMDGSELMVRVEESAIEAALKSTMTSDSIMDSSPICMVEYVDDIEGFEMPCRHFFHKECITKWLSVSHYCPCCRLELPTEP